MLAAPSPAAYSLAYSETSLHARQPLVPFLLMRFLAVVVDCTDRVAINTSTLSTA